MPKKSKVIIFIVVANLAALKLIKVNINKMKKSGT